MNYLDLILGGLIVYGAVKGFFKGLIIEAASLVALLLGVVCALLFSAALEGVLASFFQAEHLPPSGVIFLIIFIGVIIGVNLLARLITKVLKMAALGFINRIFGALFGGLKFALALSALILLIEQFSFLFHYFDTQILDDSYLYKPLKVFGESLFEWLLEHKEELPQELV